MMSSSEPAGRPTTTDLRFSEISRRLECIEAGQNAENKTLTELLVASTKSQTERAELRDEVGDIKAELRRELGEIKNIVRQVQSHTHAEEFKVLDTVRITLWGVDSNGGLVARVRTGMIVGAFFVSILTPVIVWFIIKALEGKLP